MIQELDTVVLARNLPAHGLRAGDVGTVVLVHQDGAGLTVEFLSLNGETVAVVTVPAADVRPARHGEIAHARPLAAV